MPSQTVVSLIRGMQIWTLLESTFSLLRLSNAQAGKCKFTLLNRHACIFKHKYLLNITFYKKWLIYLINDIDCLMQVSRCNIIFSMLDFFFFSCIFGFLWFILLALTCELNLFVLWKELLPSKLFAIFVSFYFFIFYTCFSLMFLYITESVHFSLFIGFVV